MNQSIHSGLLKLGFEAEPCKCNTDSPLFNTTYSKPGYILICYWNRNLYDLTGTIQTTNRQTGKFSELEKAIKSI